MDGAVIVDAEEEGEREAPILSFSRIQFCHFLVSSFLFISFCRFLESKSILNHILFIDTKIAILSFCQIRFCRFVESILSFPFYFVLSFSRIEVYIKSYFIHRYKNCYFVFLSNSVLSFSF